MFLQVIKNINNNVVICMDDYGRELVAFGKGLGFPAAPYELTDLSKVQRTFYNISPQYLTMLDAFPYDVLELTASIVDVAKGELSYIAVTLPMFNIFWNGSTPAKTSTALTPTSTAAFAANTPIPPSAWTRSFNISSGSTVLR